MEKTLQGKVALVTGASRGIGQAIAQRLGQMGATVIGTATSDKGAAAIEEAFDKAGVGGAGRVLNVTDEASISALFDDMKANFEAPHIVVNNAGITRDNLIMRMSDDEWDAVFAANLRGVFKICKQAIRPMMKARWGRIINISSVVGATGNAGQVNYAATKAGVVGFSKSLAQEVASRNITVNVVAPGFIETDMTGVLDEGVKEKLLTQIPMGRMGQGADIAAAVAFLAGDDAAYVTGQTLHVNGGMLMA